MKEVSYDGRWSVPLTDEQYEVGKIAVQRPEATHFSVFSALKGAGVPVRADNKYPASQAATAFQYQRLIGELR